MMRQAISFAVKAVLIAAGRTPDPYPEGPIRVGRYSLRPPPVPACICETTWMAA